LLTVRPPIWTSFMANLSGKGRDTDLPQNRARCQRAAYPVTCSRKIATVIENIRYRPPKISMTTSVFSNDLG
jgi:hypothetical protein